MDDDAKKPPAILPQETADYDIGYGKPPKRTQFRKGQSGNPRGRKRRTRADASLLSKVLDETITITENGLPRKIKKREAALLSLIAKALRGDMRAMDILLKQTHRDAEASASNAPQFARIERVIVNPKMPDDEWMNRYGHGNRTDIARQDLERMTAPQIERLFRMHGGALTFTDEANKLY
ncbi:MAG TPA: DUF5681 domain-containing protein [Parvularculaceae bacterium]|nr:hypothetical protein [Amphiplicatus sp.]MCB9956681.1 hypothetical protein [Caulobacterales bacterium]HPE32329.1 DUF5681 domain-containing protein [Parvularculaceae bacterium]HRX41104.1 DUF5681 domain-containing protein [Parvularculaceae bacterium]